MVAGFRFGMMLQLAVGPVCFLILQTAMTTSFSAAFGGVFAVTLADGLWMGAALLGVGRLLQYERLQRLFPLVGAAVLLLFGIDTVFSAWNVPLLSVQPGQTAVETFRQALLLTLANPLTIVFWAGVFATKMAERRDLMAFSSGALLATVLFLSVVVVIGHFVKVALSPALVTMLTIFVGLVLISFAGRTVWQVMRRVS